MNHQEIKEQQPENSNNPIHNCSAKLISIGNDKSLNSMEKLNERNNYKVKLKNILNLLICLFLSKVLETWKTSPKIHKDDRIIDCTSGKDNLARDSNLQMNTDRSNNDNG